MGAILTETPELTTKNCDSLAQKPLSLWCSVGYALRFKFLLPFPEKSYPVAVQRTYMAKPGEVEKQWHVVDATDEVLGRLAGDIAVILMGKHRPEYTPHVDCGDFVIVTNVEKIGMTGNKMNDRHYTWYTGYPGLRLESYQDRQARKPEDLLLHAVRRMLPKNKLARHMLSKLKMYSGPDHPHAAQQPVELVRKSKKVTA